MSETWPSEFDGDDVRIEISSVASGPLFMDCDACGGYHRVDMTCDEAWA